MVNNPEKQSLLKNEDTSAYNSTSAGTTTTPTAPGEGEVPPAEGNYYFHTQIIKFALLCSSLLLCCVL